MRRHCFAVALVVLSTILAQTARCGGNDGSDKDARMKWFREAKFGLFIHWGLYAVPAGEWKGKPVAGIGEWIMNRAQIPVKEYEQLAKQFNPVKFDADAWVKMAKDAGMKYVVITSKHHDGFAMFKSNASPYNIVDATPFKRDPMKELSAACAQYGLKFAFYYSQTQDWYEPNGDGNDWDFTDPSKRDFRKYLDEKVKPQIREILTNYGPIGLVWFDTPRNMTAAQSKELADLVHELQPDCLVDGRIGNNMGDYGTKGDNKIPTGATDSDWETPATLNNTWGFKKDDQNWKSVTQLVRALIEVTSKGGNYLLNVGPTAEGVIPEPSAERLRQVGAWLNVNGDAIYGTQMSPFVAEPEWGMITVKPGKMYLHVFEWPKDGTLGLSGLRNKVLSASIPAIGKNLSFHQDVTGAQSLLTIDVPRTAPDTIATVVELSVEGALQVDAGIQQQPSGRIVLYGIQCEIHKGADSSKIRKDDTGILSWMKTDESVRWEFTVSKPGTFDVTLASFEIPRGSGRTRKSVVERGHQFVVSVAGQEVPFTFSPGENDVERPSPYFKDVVAKAGTVRIPAPGKYTLTLKARSLTTQEGLGATVRWLRLDPQ